MKKQPFSRWHAFGQSTNIMIYKFKHKELTLLIGVIVAAIVIFTLWIREPSNPFPRTSKAPGVPTFQMLKKSMIKNYLNGFEELLSGRNNPYSD